MRGKRLLAFCLIISLVFGNVNYSYAMEETEMQTIEENETEQSQEETKEEVVEEVQKESENEEASYSQEQSSETVIEKPEEAESVMSSDKEPEIESESEVATEEEVETETETEEETETETEPSIWLLADGQSEGTKITIYTSDGLTEYSFDSFSDAVAKMQEDTANTYHIQLNEDIELTDNSLYFEDNMSIGNLYLNGNTLTVSQDAQINMNILGEEGDTSRIYIEEGVTLSLLPSNQSAWCGLSEFVFEGETSTSGKLVLGENDENSNYRLTGVRLENICDTVLEGKVSVEESISFQNLTIKGMPTFKGSVVVNGTTTIEQVSYSGISLENGAKATFQDMEWVSNDFNTYMPILLYYDTEDLITTEKLVFNGDLQKDGQIVEGYIFHPQRFGPDSNSSQSFREGDVIATISTDSNVGSEHFYLSPNGITNYYAKKQNNKLSVITPEVKVTINEYENGSWKGSSDKIYETFELAAAQMATDFEIPMDFPQDYSVMIDFYEDVKLTKDVTLPYMGPHISLIPPTISDTTGSYIMERKLDVNGHTLTIPSAVQITEGIKVVNSNTGKEGFVKLVQEKEEDFIYLSFYDSMKDVPLRAEGNPSDNIRNDEDYVLTQNVHFVVEEGGIFFNVEDGDGRVYKLDSDFKVSNFNISSGSWSFRNVEVLDYSELSENASVSVNSLTYSGLVCNTGVLKVTQEISGTSSLINGGVVIADVLNISKGSFANGQVYSQEINGTVATPAEAQFNKIVSAKSISNSEGSLIICNELNQVKGNTLRLSEDSILIINRAAIINDIILDCYGEDYNTVYYPYLYWLPTAEISINGELTKYNSNSALKIGIINSDMDLSYDRFADAILNDYATTNIPREEWPNFDTNKLVQPEKNSKLFFTSNAAYPTEYLIINTREEAKYTNMYQEGNAVYIGRQWITVKSQNATGREEVLRSFIQWKDAATYLDTLSNTEMTYVVEISEDLNVNGTLTLPKNVKKIVFRGVGGDSATDSIGLTYEGDIKLVTDTCFERVNLTATKNGQPYKSVLTLNGKNMELIQTTVNLQSVSGTNASKLYVNGKDSFNNLQVTVDKFIKTLDTLEVKNATLWIGDGLKLTEAAISEVKDLTLENATLQVSNGSVAITGTTTMTSAVLDTNGKINLVNLVSCDDRNEICYAGTGSGKNANILYLTGTVSTVSEYARERAVTLQNSDHTAENILCQAAAIDITNKYVAGNYTTDTVLVNAPKASSAWFVVGSTFDQSDNRTVEYITRKEGVEIKCDYASVATIVLKSSKDSDDTYVINGNYASLQAAFDEIERIADTTGRYQIILSEDVSVVSGKNALIAITTPAKAENIIICSNDDTNKVISYNGGFTLKTNVEMQGIELAAQGTKTPVTLNNFSLTMKNCNVAEGNSLTEIAGSGTANASALVLENTNLTVKGVVNNIATVELNACDLTAEGAINIGTIRNINGSESLRGIATVTRNKDGDITKVVPQITIQYDTVTNDYGIIIGLQEKTKTACEPIDFSDAQNLCETGIQLVKAPILSSEDVAVDADYNGLNGDGVITKKGGYLVYTEAVYLAELHYTNTDGENVATKCRTFADAVAEINSLKKKRDYCIVLTGEEEVEDSKAITMPGKNSINTLTIMGIDDSVATLYYTGKITLTTNTVLDNVAFVQTIKTKEGYSVPETDYPAAVTLSTGGNALTIDGVVTFNTPLLLDGGNKGALRITEYGQLSTETNGEIVTGEENLILGSITGFSKVDVEDGQSLLLRQYALSDAEDAKLSGGELNKITNLNVGGTLEVAEKAVLTNVTLFDHAVIKADKDFTISGLLTSTTSEAYLYTTQKTGKNIAPYLAINGTVTLENATTDKIHIGVYDSDEDFVVLADAPAATGQLLTAKTADVDKFLPVTENVGSRKAYSASAEDGYILKKAGTAIYVYYADEVQVAVCAGDVSDGNMSAATVLGYYPSYADAVSAVDAYKNNQAEYTIVLLQDVGSEEAPLKQFTLPKNAANITITSISTADSIPKNIYYIGKVSLKTDTVLNDICLNPMKKAGQAASSDIATGNYDLTLRDIGIGEVTGMEIKNVTGSTKQKIILDTDNLQITGNVTKTSELILESSAVIGGNVQAAAVTFSSESIGADLSVAGTFTTDTLHFAGAGYVTVDKAVTIKNVISENNTVTDWNNTISYQRDSKDVPYLKLTGNIIINSGKPVVLNMVTQKNDYVLTEENKQVTLRDDKKLATMEQAALSECEFRINGNELSTDYVPVKAKKGVYLVEKTSHAGRNRVVLASSADSTVTTFLDYAQAIEEINNRKNAAITYEIIVGCEIDRLQDANVTDAIEVTNITMPKAKTSASIVIKSANEGTQTFISGIPNISYDADLTLVDVSTYAGKISVPKLTMDNASIISLDEAKVNTFQMIGEKESGWNALGKTTINDVEVQDNAMQVGSFIAARQADKTLLPQLTITGNVTGILPIRVAIPSSSSVRIEYVSQYADIPLVLATKESADHFRADEFRAIDASGTIADNDEGITAENLAAYKNAQGYVMNGSKEEMLVQITKAGETDVTYAKNYEEAVTLINNMADANGSYTMQFMSSDNTTDIEVKTGKDGAYGTFITPTKAANVTIKGAEVTGVNTIIPYTGKLTPDCNVTLENLVLTEGTVKDGVFAPTYQVSPAITKDYDLTLSENVRTLQAENADMIFASVSATKGSLTILNSVEVVGDINITNLNISCDSTLESQTGKVTIQNIHEICGAEDCTNSAHIAGTKAITITNIKAADDGSAKLTLDTYFTAITKPEQQSVTQLAINGDISGVEVSIAPMLYDLNAKTYHAMTAAELSGTLVSGTPKKEQSFAAMPKAASKDITLRYVTANEDWENELKLYKQDGSLYATADHIVVSVYGYQEENAEDYIYAAQFADWNQAVKEIDKRGATDVYYEMVVMENIGESAYSVPVMKTLTLPAKAKKVHITSEENEENFIFFQDHKITLKCNTTFDRVGLSTVVKMVNISYAFATIPLNINAGKYDLEITDFLRNVNSINYMYPKYNWIGDVSGKGSFRYTGTNTGMNAAEKISGFSTVEIWNQEEMTEIDQDKTVENIYISSMSGVGTLIVHPSTEIVCLDGDLSVKNLQLKGSGVSAKNITVSETTTLESSQISAGMLSKAGDGKCKLGNIIVKDNANVISAKQDAKGQSQLEVTGTVTPSEDYKGGSKESAIIVGIHYNNNMERFAQLYRGMKLLTAQKAMASWFAPLYTSEDDNNITYSGMGYEEDGFCLYKSGKEIQYGKASDMEVELTLIENVTSGTYFKTFEEAVKEIDSLSLYKSGTKNFADYEIHLVTDVEIDNEKGNGSYKALSLPKKAGSVKISSDVDHSIHFSGNVSLKSNLELENISMIPMKKSGKAVVPTTANYALGNYSLTLENVETKDGNGNNLIGNISGSAKSGSLTVIGGKGTEETYVIDVKAVTGLQSVYLYHNTELNVAGNYKTNQIVFHAENDTAIECVKLNVAGSLNADILYKYGSGNAVIGKASGEEINIKDVELAEDSQAITICMAASELRQGTQILKSTYPDKNEFQIMDEIGNTYGTYIYGTALKLGNRTA